MDFGMLSFTTTEWRSVPFTEHAGAPGTARWQTIQAGHVRVRMVEYSRARRGREWSDGGGPVAGGGPLCNSRGDMSAVIIVVVQHADGYIAYPFGMKGVVIGQGDSYEDALLDVKSRVLRVRDPRASGLPR